jgi:hypothetical protein
MNSKSLRHFLFIQISLLWIFINLLMSISSLSPYSLFLLGLRDSWVLTFLILLILESKIKYLIPLSICLLLGFLPIVYQAELFVFKVFLYGVRDIFLFFFLIYIVDSNVCSYEKKYINLCFYIIILGSLFQLITQYLYGDSYFYTFSNPDIYYGSKGVSTNSSGGLFGSRLFYPLYSSSLIGTFLALYFFAKVKVINKILSLLISILTFSKAILVILFLYSFKKKRNFIILLLIISVFFLPPILKTILNENETGILTFHVSSIIDRFNAFDYLKQSFFMLPDYIGYNTIAGYVLTGRDASLASESFIISHIIDYKILIFVVFPFLLFLISSIKPQSRKNLYPLFFILFFSSLSNHPIAFLPVILLINKTNFN